MFSSRTTKLDRGLDAFERKEWRRARRLLEDAMEAEERATGHYHLGMLYWRGLGGARDVRAAVDCFARAAEQGHAAAQTAYGIALRSGVGCAKDVTQAHALFRYAAGAGDREAMLQLSTFGDNEDGQRWLRRAAELGYAPAMMHLSDVLMETDPVESLSWLYAAVSLTADETARKRANRLAREMTASEIDMAQKAGRAHAKDVREREGL